MLSLLLPKMLSRSELQAVQAEARMMAMLMLTIFFFLSITMEFLATE